MSKKRAQRWGGAPRWGPKTAAGLGWDPGTAGCALPVTVASGQAGRKARRADPEQRFSSSPGFPEQGRGLKVASLAPCTGLVAYQAGNTGPRHILLLLPGQLLWAGKCSALWWWLLLGPQLLPPALPHLALSPATTAGVHAVPLHTACTVRWAHRVALATRDVSPCLQKPPAASRLGLGLPRLLPACVFWASSHAQELGFKRPLWPHSSLNPGPSPCPEPWEPLGRVGGNRPAATTLACSPSPSSPRCLAVHSQANPFTSLGLHFLSCQI